MVAHIFSVVLVISLYCSISVQGCSEFLLNTTLDGVVSGRTMDFTIDLETVLEVIPRETVFNEPPIFGCHDCPSYQWKSKYGFVAFQSFGMNVASDGLNEKGLSAAALYLVGTEYPTPSKNDKKPIIANIATYLLGNFATIQDVKDGIQHLQFAEIDAPLIGQLMNLPSFRVPLHYILHDAKGQSLVIEFVEGNVHVLDNPKGIATNEPPLDWHLTNFDIHKSDSIPGGYSSESRFLRLAILNSYAALNYTANTSYSVAEKEQSMVSDALHLLNTVVLPKGIDSAEEDLTSGATQWSVVRDHVNLKLYIQSTQNQLLRSIELKKLDFSKSKNSRHALNVEHGHWTDDISDKLRNNDLNKRTQDFPSSRRLELLRHHTEVPMEFQSNQHVSNSKPIPTNNNNGMLMGFAMGVGVSVVVIKAVLTIHNRRKNYDLLV